MSPRKKAGEEAAPEEELSIEETFARLEEVLAHIEEGECSLEETFQYYEKGMKISKGVSRQDRPGGETDSGARRGRRRIMMGEERLIRETAETEAM